MRTFIGAACCCAAVAAGAGTAKASSSKTASATAGAASEPLLTVEGSFNFVKDSVETLKNLGCFAGHAAFGAVWQFVPPNVQDQVTVQYNMVVGEVEKQRLKNGVPSVTQMQTKVSGEWDKHVTPNVEKVVGIVRKAAPVKIIGAAISVFEDQYPASKGKLPSDPINLALVMFFLVYVIGLKVVKPLLCYFLCCGMCRGRNKAAAKAATPKVNSGNARKRR